MFHLDVLTEVMCALRVCAVFVHGLTSLLRVTGHMYPICDGLVREALCRHVVLVIRPFLSLVCRSYKKTCFSDPAVRTIWNIPWDHLHLMWRQVHNKAVQVFFLPVSHMENTFC